MYTLYLGTRIFDTKIYHEGRFWCTKNTTPNS